MLKENPRSLRQYFALIAVASFFPVVADAVQGSLSSLATPLSFANFSSGVAFTYITIRFPALLRKPRFIQIVLTLCGVWTLVYFAMSLRSGLTIASVFVFVISVLILVYLMKSVARLSREVAQKNA